MYSRALYNPNNLFNRLKTAWRFEGCTYKTQQILRFIFQKTTKIEILYLKMNLIFFFFEKEKHYPLYSLILDANKSTRIVPQKDEINVV